MDQRGTKWILYDLPKIAVKMNSEASPATKADLLKADIKTSIIQCARSRLAAARVRRTEKQ